MQDDPPVPQTLPARTQLYAVTGAAIIALLGIGLYHALEAGDHGAAAPSAPQHMALYIPTPDQRAALKTESVGHRIFHTEIVADGYVAPNGGFASTGSGTIVHGLPILAGQSSDIFQAESDLVTASAQYRAAEMNEKRQHELYDSEGAAQKDWQQAQVDLATAAAALSSARNRLRILGKSDSMIAALEQQASRPQQSGSAAPAAFSVGDLSTVWLVANVREADAGLVHPGDQVQVRVPAFPQKIFNAAIAYVSPVIDPATHRLVVGAQIANPGDALKPNMQATVTIEAGQASDAPAIPETAIVHEGDAARVWVADGHDLALRNVTLGRTSDGMAEVTKGLSVGEKIVTGGALFVDQAAGGS